MRSSLRLQEADDLSGIKLATQRVPARNLEQIALSRIRRSVTGQAPHKKRALFRTSQIARHFTVWAKARAYFVQGARCLMQTTHCERTADVHQSAFPLDQNVLRKE